MPWIYGFLRSAQSDEPTKQIIEQYTHDHGFGSLTELKSSLDELREQLKQKLPEKEWKVYFKGTEDIQLK